MGKLLKFCLNLVRSAGPTARQCVCNT
jgi:hypothetical protein